MSGTASQPRPGTDPSPREFQALWYAAHGLDRRNIAAAMRIDELTVKTHLQRASKRLESKGTAHAVAICFRRGTWCALRTN